ncbi:hypothetical protein PAAG_12101 [Paracoccidioides lutzii Pb01]|uniref:Uncharacterized protein n=1 Tax=Paracoccidioides lutzii (strain ATCC MYA-826 / Pb01) TaxID=502779 RepID=A0A0A2V4H2_PARBA|nr:hypothetical protein PAAG_12101 [Paracoccidioides lutzii Pb01]KGQ01242.1 hypothetical protein PAAG_12101 [Paracoccidioides lutzii Pb01]
MDRQSTRSDQAVRELLTSNISPPRMPRTKYVEFNLMLKLKVIIAPEQAMTMPGLVLDRISE